MKTIFEIRSIPLWPLVKNTFLISLVIFIIFSFILGLLWLGFIREFSHVMTDPGLHFPSDTLANISGIFVVMFALLNGFLGSIVATMIVGLGGLVYNLVNNRGGGVELELSRMNSRSGAGTEFGAYFPGQYTTELESEPPNRTGEQE